jgi:hypothetical protein
MVGFPFTLLDQDPIPWIRRNTVPYNNSLPLAHIAVRFPCDTDTQTHPTRAPLGEL